ncbi:PTS sugar transporter [Enterococcus canis]|uniref:PTS sugar transporter n=1 Tax=Enterococcus canis TaxID=214095 RepID=A0A1L8RG69_9ENTE|nr:PTS lactose/cellobiose transporter subunit IIA [Enterococcus canis]OJG18713.1 PTS sugar transporter [Enterococcus canis]
MEGREQVCFQLISNAGAARSACFEAIRHFKQGATDKGQELLKTSDNYYTEAHSWHGQLVKQEAGGDTVWMSLLLTHAEDLMMSAELTKAFAQEFIDLHQEVAQLKQVVQQLVPVAEY